MKFALIRQSCCKNVQLPQCSSWQSKRTGSFVLTLSLFHTGENIAFPWLQCWGFHVKKSPAGYVCISRPEIVSQSPRLFSQPVCILLCVFTHPLYLPGESQGLSQAEIRGTRQDLKRQIYMQQISSPLAFYSFFLKN